MKTHRYQRGACAMLLASGAVLLVGCASAPAPTAGYDPTCAREASADPQVEAARARAIGVVSAGPFSYSNSTPQQNAQDVYRNAVLACMQRRGMTLPGGVESVRKYPYGLSGF